MWGIQKYPPAPSLPPTSRFGTGMTRDQLLDCCLLVVAEGFLGLGRAFVVAGGLVIGRRCDASRSWLGWIPGCLVRTRGGGLTIHMHSIPDAWSRPLRCWVLCCCVGLPGQKRAIHALPALLPDSTVVLSVSRQTRQDFFLTIVVTIVFERACWMICLARFVERSLFHNRWTVVFFF